MKVIKNNKFKIPIIFMVVLIFLISSFMIYCKINNTFIFQKSIIKQQTENGQVIKSQSVNNTENNKVTSGSDQPPAPTIIPGTDKKSVEMSVTSINQNNSDLQIRILISTLTNSGSCNLELSKEGYDKISLVSEVQPLSNTSTCKGFNIPLSNLSSGDWNLVINFENESLTSKIAQIINVK